MGICTSAQNTRKTDTKPEKQASMMIVGDKYESSPKMTMNSLLNQLDELKNQLQPKPYDYANPHRQYNVIYGGVLFDVVNSLEASLGGIPEEE